MPGEGPASTPCLRASNKHGIVCRERSASDSTTRLYDRRALGIRHEIDGNIDSAVAPDQCPSLPPRAKTRSGAWVRSGGLHQAERLKLRILDVERLAILHDMGRTNFRVHEGVSLQCEVTARRSWHTDKGTNLFVRACGKIQMQHRIISTPADRKILPPQPRVRTAVRTKGNRFQNGDPGSGGHQRRTSPEDGFRDGFERMIEHIFIIIRCREGL